MVAARYELDTTPSGPLGHFVYGRTYLARANALPLDPVSLPLSDEAFTTTRNGGMFGALRDTAPDAWGRLVLERSRPGRVWTELDYLLGASAQRVGALSYGPGAEAPSPAGLPVRLEALERLGSAAAALEGEGMGVASSTEAELDLLIGPSSGLGGARPKASVADEHGQLWVAKFAARGDRRVNAITEGAWLALAAECGIRVPAHRIVQVAGRPTLLVRRFDQEPTSQGERRRFYLSAHTLLGCDETAMDRRGWSYPELAHLVRRISDEPEQDVHELFRRMVFNALVTNLDDHPRNHAFVGTPSGGWRLSPAFDLVASNAASQERRDLAMACGLLPGRERWANRANLISGARHFGLAPDDADAVISDLKRVVLASWEKQIRAQGGTEQDCRNVAHAVAYPGFELPA